MNKSGKRSTFARAAVRLLVPAIVLVSLAGCASTEAEFTGAAGAAAAGDSATFTVYGMDCPGCHGGVEKLVEKIPGVRSAEANYRAQELKVLAEPGAEVDEAAIRDAVERANFTLAPDAS